VTEPSAWSRAARFVNKPYYIFRPSQILRRLFLAPRYGAMDEREWPVVRLPWDVELRIIPHDMIGSSILRTAVYDLVLTEALFRLVDRGETTVDAGANIGYTTSVLALCSGSRGRVLAFEPHPLLVELMTENISRWPRARVGDVVVHPTALSDRASRAWLNPGWNLGASTVALEPESSAYSIDVMQLDSIIEEARIGLWKLDVEGHELHAIRGAEKLIETHRVRDLLFEEHRGYPSDVTDFLEAAGYTVFGLHQRLLGPELAAPARPRRPNWDPPNYLGTTEPARAQARMRPRGWLSLKRHRSHL
jgi:FkbM family methyltransferase